MLDLYSLTPMQFEDLCFEYSSRIYDNKNYVLFHTQYSHDGGKDMEINFYDELHRYKIWAECKQHTQNIGLEEIGKNIVLVIANHINKILFFSASNIRQSARTEILKIARRLNFVVEFLDGPILVQELERYPDIIKLYFEDYEYPDETNVIEDLSFKVHVSENTQDDFLSENEHTVYLKGGKLFFINLLIENHTSNYYADFSANFENIPDNIEVLEINDSENIPVEISPHSDLGISYLCTIKNSFWEKIKLPALEINYSSSDNSYKSISVALPTLDLSKYIVYQFMGKSYIEFIANEIKKGIVLSKAQIPQFYDIRGGAGTGKSRLIEEMKIVYLENGIYTYQYDCSDYLELDLIKKLICDLLNLPPVYKNPDFKREGLNEYTDRFKLSSECKKRLSDFIFTYSYDGVSYLPLIFSFIELLKKHIPRKAIFIAIDNIQESSPSFVDFLQRLIMELQKEPLQLSMTFVVNTEYIPEESYDSCQKYMRFMNNHANRKNQFHVSECAGFTYNDRLLFWMEAFNRHIPNDQLILRLTNYFGDTPLELVTACDYLKKNGIMAEDKSGEWYIKKQEALDELFQYTLKDFDALFDRRFHSFLSHQSEENQEKVADIITAVVCFRNNMPPEFAIDCELNLKLIELLIRNKILRVKTTENTFAFYHDCIYRYFTSDISRNIGRMDYTVIKYLIENDIRNKDYLLFFIYHRHGNTIKLKEYGLKLLNEKISIYSYHEAIEIGRVLYEHAELKLDIEYYLECATLYAFSLSSNGNKDLSCKLFMALCPLILKNQKKLPSERVGEFFRDAVNSQLQCFYFAQAKVVIDYYKKVEDLSLKYQFLIFNREGVVDLSLGNFSKAKEDFEKSLAIAEKVNNKFFWSSTTHSDLALLYFYSEPTENNRQSCIEEFRKAIEEYGLCKDNTRFRKCEILWHKAFISILQGRYDEAIKPLSEALAIRAQSQEVYTVYRINNLMALVYLYIGHIKEAEELLLSVKSICEVHHYESGVLRLCNNLGVTYRLKNEPCKSNEYFSLALSLLKPDISSLKLYPVITNNYRSCLTSDESRLVFLKNCATQTCNKRLIQHCKQIKNNAGGFTFWSFGGFDYIF